MSSNTATAARPADAPLTALPREQTVLIATDGTPSSEPALRLALALAGRGAHIHALFVVDTRPVPIPPPLDAAIAIADTTYGDAFRAQNEAELRDTLSATLGRPIDWPVQVVLGTPSHAIVRAAQRLHADLIIVGLRHHSGIERVGDSETALHVMRSAVCPVVGVTAPLAGVPSRVLVAVDFSRASLEAARAADRLVGPTGTLVLGYVPPSSVFVPDDGERIIRELGVAAAFKWFRAQLGRAEGAPVEDVILERGPTERVAEVLLTWADGARIDMIALGSLRHGRIERWIVGSVTTDVAHDASRSMLVVPPPQDVAET